MKTILSRTPVALLLCLFLFSACTKDSSDSNNSYVKLKINGNWVTWKSVIGEIVADPGSTQSGFDFTSHNDANTESFALGITVDGSSFSTGTYTPDNSFSSLSYMKKINTPDFESYNGGGIMGGSDTRYDITISSITNKMVKGSFKGTYLRNDADDTDLLVITEGEFSVPRVR